ncbi:MAG: aldo/keto reductase [Chloroflexi bacterium]|nr:aldo/keto reductase [Chloroflexota bacterium]OJV95946.1 MAG: oxidoreductase [Chloroflexi bacterium 54-19]
MEYRKLGKSGIEVSEIGFGSWAIGGNQWGPVDNRESVAALKKAIELGINFIDTADVYGDGVSEEIVAEAIKGNRDKVVISTKGGLFGHHRDPQREPVYDTPEKVIAACDNSLKRLGTDYIDVYFCHLWWDKEEETEAFMRAFEDLKKAGKVRVTGVSAEDFAYIKHFNREGNLDVVQVDYSILNRNPEKEVLPYLKENGIGVVVKGPLRMGILTGKFNSQTTFTDTDIRQNWPQEAWFKESLAKVERLRPLTESGNGGSDSLAQLALRFVLANDAVSVAIPGAKTPQQVEENASASVRPLLTTQERQALEELTGAALAG